MRIGILAAATVLAVSGATFAQAQTASKSNLPDINVGSAKIEGDKITGVSVTIDRPGYLVIHNDAAGKPPASLGHIKLSPGTTTNVVIPADATLDPASHIELMLHYETNDNDTYDFGPDHTDVDTPVMGAGDKVVMVPMNAM
jgi:hypothetical protein